MLKFLDLISIDLDKRNKQNNPLQWIPILSRTYSCKIKGFTEQLHL